MHTNPFNLHNKHYEVRAVISPILRMRGQGHRETQGHIDTKGQNQDINPVYC